MEQNKQTNSHSHCIRYCVLG